MSDSKLSALTAATTFDDDDVLYIVNSDGSRKVTTLDLLGTARPALTSSPSAGDTTFDVAAVTEGMVAGARIVIDPYTNEAEVRQISSVSGNTITVTSALKFAHDSGDRVFIHGGKSLPVEVWGPPSTDDSSVLQEAHDQCSPYGVALDGQGRTYTLTVPLMLNSSFKLKDITLKASASFAPSDTTNAMVMGYNGSTPAVASADLSTNVITTSSAHNLPGPDIGIVFLGDDLPGGLTAGKFYYVKSKPTTTTLTVSETSGGTTVDITSTGTGYAYCEVYAANMKSYLDDVLIDGQNVANINGILVSVQQQGHWVNARVDNCPGFGVKMKGQHHVVSNFESVNCGKALVLDNMSFLYVFGFNAERCDRAIHSVQSTNCLFDGVHLEMSDGLSVATSVAFDLESATNFIADNVQFSSLGGTQKLVWAHGVSANQVSYEIRNVNGFGRIDDDNRGHDFTGDSGGTNNVFWKVSAPQLPSSQSYDDPAPIKILGPGGRYLAMGAQNNDQAQLLARVGSSQTGAPIRVLNTSDTEVFSVTPAGQLVVNNGPKIIAGSGTPESAVTAPVGSVFLRSDGGAGTSFYMKESGVGNTGWVAK